MRGRCQAQLLSTAIVDAISFCDRRVLVHWNSLALTDPVACVRSPFLAAACNDGMDGLSDATAGAQGAFHLARFAIPATEWRAIAVCGWSPQSCMRPCLRLSSPCGPGH